MNAESNERENKESKLLLPQEIVVERIPTYTTGQRSASNTVKSTQKDISFQKKVRISPVHSKFTFEKQMELQSFRVTNNEESRETKKRVKSISG